MFQLTRMTRIQMTVLSTESVTTAVTLMTTHIHHSLSTRVTSFSSSDTAERRVGFVSHQYRL